MVELEKIEKYCKALEERMVKKFPNCETIHHKYKYKVMQKYIKVIQCDYRGNESSVWCFIDFDGNLLKAESWNKPAKGIRGHIDNPIMELGQFYK